MSVLFSQKRVYHEHTVMTHHGFNQVKYFEDLLSLYVRTKPHAYIFGETDHSLIVVIRAQHILEKCMCKIHSIAEEKKNKCDGKTCKRYPV